MLTETTLRDGTPAMIWPLLPEDRKALREGFAALSARSRYDRFLSGVSQLSEPMLRVLVDDVDGVDHVALALVAFPSTGDEQVVGVARLMRYRASPDAADIAVTVVDEWHGRGVATALLAALLPRRPPDVTRLVTQVAADNRASLAMLGGLGRVRTEPAGSGVLTVTVDLPAASPERP